MAIIQKPNAIRRAFNPIVFQVTDENVDIYFRYPNDVTKSVRISRVKVNNVMSADVSGVVKRLFKDIRDALDTGATGLWAFEDFNLKADFAVMGEMYTAINAVAQPGEPDKLPPVLSDRPFTRNRITIPKYAGYPVGVAILDVSEYDDQGAPDYEDIRFTGTVVDDDGVSVSDASVTVYGDETIVAAGSTSSTGTFAITWRTTEVAYNVYARIRVVINKTGFAAKTVGVAKAAFEQAVATGYVVNAALVPLSASIPVSVTIRDSVTNTVLSGALFVLLADGVPAFYATSGADGVASGFWSISETDYNAIGSLTSETTRSGYGAVTAAVAKPTYADAIASGIALSRKLVPEWVPESIKIFGYVKDENGTGIPGASVEIRDGSSRDTYIATVNADSNGYFEYVWGTSRDDFSGLIKCIASRDGYSVEQIVHSYDFEDAAINGARFDFTLSAIAGSLIVIRGTAINGKYALANREIEMFADGVSIGTAVSDWRGQFIISWGVSEAAYNAMQNLTYSSPDTVSGATVFDKPNFADAVENGIDYQAYFATNSSYSIQAIGSATDAVTGERVGEYDYEIRAKTGDILSSGTASNIGIYSYTRSMLPSEYDTLTPYSYTFTKAGYETVDVIGETIPFANAAANGLYTAIEFTPNS